MTGFEKVLNTLADTQPGIMQLQVEREERLPSSEAGYAAKLSSSANEGHYSCHKCKTYQVILY
jgi:hypothetical protein